MQAEICSSVLSCLESEEEIGQENTWVEDLLPVTCVHLLIGMKAIQLCSTVVYLLWCVRYADFGLPQPQNAGSLIALIYPLTRVGRQASLDGKNHC